MTEMRKITAFVPAELIDGTTRLSGVGLTETLREALRRYQHHLACQRLLAMEGQVEFELDWRELRGKDDA